MKGLTHEEIDKRVLAAMETPTAPQQQAGTPTRQQAIPQANLERLMSKARGYRQPEPKYTKEQQSDIKAAGM
ncbi:MAG: hypothetical protein WDA59_09265 [Methanofastidiosum sp.]